MRAPWLQSVLAFGFLAACTGQSSIKSAEVLDERTGMTVGALAAPIEFVEAMRLNATVADEHASFAYLGPVEWDQMGHISYGLWVNVAPGNDRQIGDLHRPQAATLLLDGSPLTLTTIDPPQPGRAPYHAVASWGQAAYFELTEDMVKQMAQSAKLELRLRADDGIAVFTPSRDTRETLAQFARARGITVD